MVQPLPTSDFRFLSQEEIDSLDIMSEPEDRLYTGRRSRIPERATRPTQRFSAGAGETRRYGADVVSLYQFFSDGDDQTRFR